MAVRRMSLNHIFRVIVGVLALAAVTWGQECSLPGDDDNQMKGSCVPTDDCEPWKGFPHRPFKPLKESKEYKKVHEACNSQSTDVCCATKDIIIRKKDFAPECLQDRLGEAYKHNGTYPSNSSFITYIDYFDYETGERKSCGASLITSEFLLTAAHCVKRVNETLVYIGTSNKKVFHPEYNQSYPDGDEYRVTQSIIHEKYNPKTFEYDIALLRLHRAVNFSLSNSPKPVCIPMANLSYSEDSQNSSRVLITYGWGSNINGKRTESKQTVTVQEIPLAMCMKELHGTTEKMQDDGEQICTITISGHNVFPGYSGSPLMYRHKEVWFMVGLVSHGHTVDGKNSNKHPYISTFIGNNTANWIVKKISENGL